MSKLSERMRRAARTEARPVGFTTVATQPQATMLVIADLTVKEAAKAADHARNADAILLAEDTATDAIAAAAGADVPVGVRLSKADRERVTALQEAGVDFIVIGEESAASAMMEDSLSFILEVDGDPTDTELRTLDTLTVEALLAPAVDGALTIRRSVGLRRFVAFARKPLMLPVSGDSDAADLEALRELNVLLLLTPASAAGALRERVSTLPPRRRRREESNVGVPRIMLGGARAEEQPDEDDDED